MSTTGNVGHSAEKYAGFLFLCTYSFWSFSKELPLPYIFILLVFFYVLKHAESNRNIKHTWISFHAICNDPLDISSFNFLQRIYHISQRLFRKSCSQHVKQQQSATPLGSYSTSEPDMKRCVYFRGVCQKFPVFDNAMGCLVKLNS